MTRIRFAGRPGFARPAGFPGPVRPACVLLLAFAFVLPGRPAEARSDERGVRAPAKRVVVAKHGAPSTRAAVPRRSAAAEGAFADRQDVVEFVAAMAERHGFDAQALHAVFAKVRRHPDVLRLIAPPPPGFKRSWEAYRARFLDSLRIREGRQFLKDHEGALARAQQTWRVPPEIIAAIIGVETIYGRVMGDFRVIDALATLAFEYPRRAAFFREELEQFLLFAREEGADVFEVRGSFAGAIGLPQFMPGSIRRYATDFDGDGRIALRSSPVDAIGSVARFLAEHGWVGGEPTHFGAAFDGAARIAPLLEAGIEPRFSLAELAEHGVTSPDPVPEGTLLALVDLPNADKPTTYLLGARNFYVVTRYNRSSFYALAVIELAQALAQER